MFCVMMFQYWHTWLICETEIFVARLAQSVEHQTFMADIVSEEI